MQRTILNPEWGIATCVEVNGIVFIGHHGGHTANGQKLFTIEEQADNTFQNLKTTLEKVGLGFEDIVNLNVLLKDIKDFHGMHSVWTKWFPRVFPARTCYTTAFVDDHCLIQVYGVAYRK